MRIYICTTTESWGGGGGDNGVIISILKCVEVEKSLKTRPRWKSEKDGFNTMKLDRVKYYPSV